MISKMSPNDINDINNLGEIITKDFKKLYNLNKITNNDKIIIYKQNNKTIGFIHIYLGIDIIDIINIAVKQEYQNQKIGSQLLQYVIDNYQQKEEKKLMLEVKENNIQAIKLYQKYNFKIIHIRTNYYKDNTNALIMERRLNKWKMYIY